MGAGTSSAQDVQTRLNNKRSGNTSLNSEIQSEAPAAPAAEGGRRRSRGRRSRRTKRSKRTKRSRRHR